MNSYATTLIFCAMIAVVVSGSLKIQGVQTIESKYLLERLEAQKIAAQKQVKALWRKSGKPIAQSQKTSSGKKGRSLPLRPIDIKPLFAKGCDGSFESLVYAISEMPRPLFDSFLKSARRFFEEKQGAFTLVDLAAIPFDDPKERAAYFAHCKGKNSWLRRIKIADFEAKVPVHQISDEIAFLLFDAESAKRLLAKRERLTHDKNEPLWKEGDLLQLKTKSPLWRPWITSVTDSQANHECIQQTHEGSAVVERFILEK